MRRPPDLLSIRACAGAQGGSVLHGQQVDPHVTPDLCSETQVQGEGKHTLQLQLAPAHLYTVCTCIL